MAPPKRVVSPSSPSGSSAKKVRALPSGAEFETQPPDDQGLSSVDGEAVGEPATVEDIVVGGSTHLAAPLAGGCALEESPQAGLAELEYVDDPFSDEQHAAWDARVMLAVRKEGISPQVFPLTVAVALLQIILRDIKTSVKPALLDRDEIKIFELLLQHRDMLLPALEQALRIGRFAAVRRMALLREDATSSSSEGAEANFIHAPPSDPVEPLQPQAQTPMSFGDMKSAILDFEEKIRPELKRYIVGNHPTFNPPSSAVNDSTLFIDGMGGMSEKDPAVRERVEKLFSGEMDADQNLRVLFNAPGTGKTTLLVEGLCRYWGLYVVSCDDKKDPLGSKDADTAWNVLQMDPGFTPKVPLTPTKNHAVANNVKIAARTFRLVLLARLSIFDFFLRCAPPHVDEADLRRRWLYLQLRPSGLFRKMDIFDELFQAIHTVQDDNAVARRIYELEKAIRDDVHVNVGSLFFVLDQAEVASERGTEAFWSSTSGGGHGSVLGEMYNAWSEFSMAMIISGTVLPLELLTNSIHTRRERK
ncbi:hypothetical protein SCP_0805490 [Sparassis crispa]|uniref:Uncharacterized protein n=1 Tax=Sparassis crispa TaxID=139825 RepID=A0A401GUX4_9APHY|nr:hypothetical protein SCP_0805490 [Sparassis crispa]GBE86025.1 hypothetical protein SCP_0805490 [Sparassis crispa]